MNTIRPACSNKPRPSVAHGKGFFKTGESVWGRDIYHALKSGMTTYCGIDASDFLRMDEMPVSSARADHNFCLRCERQCSAIT